MAMINGQPRVGVMHITDTLDPGGTERVAVNLVNALPRDRFALSLCTTRRAGSLSELVASDVARLDLGRSRMVDAAAMARLRAFIKIHDIRILHAHSSSLFTALAGSIGRPSPVVVWHDHCGFHGTAPRPALPYRLAALRIGGVISVSESLADWARSALKVPHDRVWYIPNFVSAPAQSVAAPRLPGTAGGRIACVANFRPQKDHVGLLHAMALVVKQWPHAHLILIGREADGAQRDAVAAGIRELALDGHVTNLGERDDVAAILPRCDIGVLSSVSEGFPLALAEYGMAGLAAVTTDVGQCAEVVDGGRAGLVVPPRDARALAAALGTLLASADRRRALGNRLRDRVRQRYGADAVMDQVTRVYDSLTGGDAPRA